MAIGAPLGAFVTSGSGGLVEPFDPEFGPDGNLYVISNNPGEEQILRFDGTSGSLPRRFRRYGAGGFTGASAIEFGPNGDLYVATNSETGVAARHDGATGVFVGVAAGGNSIRRAIGIDFDPTETCTCSTQIVSLRPWPIAFCDSPRTRVPSSMRS
ncbi:MAG: hypothetical protein R3C56_24745 [Pirellulaceae bacterium]